MISWRERINPTGKKKFKEALRSNDIDYILREGISQQEKGVHILDVNVGLPEIDEKTLLTEVVEQIQAVINLPLQIDTSNAVAMEKALRLYNGKAMINSVNGKYESMSAVFPLVKKYGGVVVALTLCENSIPKTAEGRFEIAKEIYDTAIKYGIKKKDIIFDTLAMTISADKNAAKATIESLSYIRRVLGCHTSLGVSNVSFGLPQRDAVNSTFFAMALGSVISICIFRKKRMDLYYVRGRIKKAVFMRIIANGSSEFFSSISMSIMSIVFNFFLLKYGGTTGVAAFSVIMYVEVLSACLRSACAMRFSPP